MAWRIGAKTAGSILAQAAASSGGSSAPVARRSATCRPTASACSKPAAFSGPAADTAAWIPARSFSNTRGGPNRFVGRTRTR